MRHILVTTSLLALAACSSEAAGSGTTPRDPLAAPRGLEQVPLVTAADNPLTLAKAELGKQLFFEPKLSGTGKMACASCHFPEQAFTDGKAVSVKDDGSTNTRNAPTMHNVGYLDRLYWDGRAKTLEANVLAAWKAQMGGKPDDASKALAAVPGYAKAFQDACGAPPSETTVVQALASFLRNLRSGDSAFDRFVLGEANAIHEQAKAGYELFRGKAGCVVCHTPPLFTDKLFHNVGVGMTADKPDVGAAAKNAFDDPAKTGAFKTPTLRDVAKTGPWLHDGSGKTLREVVTLMGKGGIENKNRDPLMMDRGLTDAEVDQLVAFLESLTGNVSWTAPVLPK
ncbi:MAG: cytochrome c peroxidase [Planctomycetota bacterium]